MRSAELLRAKIAVPLLGGDGSAGLPARTRRPIRRERLIKAIRRLVLSRDPEFIKYGAEALSSKPHSLSDFVVAIEDDPHLPDDVFSRLRWGGKFVYVSASEAEVAALPEKFTHRGFVTVEGPTPLRFGLLGLKLPLLSRKLHYYVARKVFLIRPREITERFTYHVELVPQEPGDRKNFIVMKEIPSLERVIGRLRARFTDLPLGVIEKRARKFTDKIFPLFLTREAAMLKILERDLPKEYARRIPHVIALEKDGRGYVKRLWMNWLRNGGKPISQLEFARQAAELLHVIHDKVGIIHLDLRLDNFVVTEEGVGFVDFGSAVRIGENIQGNPMLNTLFEELMRTSQIQRMLEKMRVSGSVTSSVINDAYHNVDKAVDLFYLAVQFEAPLSNPDFHGLVKYDPHGPEAAGLAELTRDILKPQDPYHPRYRTARDILDGIIELERQLQHGEVGPPAAPPQVVAGR